MKVKQDNTFSLNRKNLNFSNSNEIDFKFQEIGSKLQSTDDSTNVFEYKICSRRNASISNEFLDLWDYEEFNGGKKNKNRKTITDGYGNHTFDFEW